MTGRTLIRDIIARKPVPRCGFWMGNPHPDTLPLYYRHFGVDTLEGLHLILRSDFRWITPQFIDSTYHRPEGKGIFDIWKYKKSLGEPGPLAPCTTVGEVEDYDWPRLEYLIFDECIEQLRNAGPGLRGKDLVPGGD